MDGGEVGTATEKERHMSSIPDLVARSKFMALTVELANVMAAVVLSEQLKEKAEADRRVKLVEYAVRLTKESKPDNPSAAYESILKGWQAEDARFNEQIDALRKFQEALGAAGQQIERAIASVPDADKWLVEMSRPATR